ncbi:isoleucine--tRNA ligase [Listeria marthii]|uniref:isoleucine--tRNA ligase n=1 Tax=Listeria marthii TaxID=529731 RepID=UPI001887162C|nr:isoleucine--tRNA ligase [Listeria marthii]MBF2535409.1 isoleucine--tRNA ligase [Listeria marthii]
MKNYSFFKYNMNIKTFFTFIVGLAIIGFGFYILATFETLRIWQFIGMYIVLSVYIICAISTYFNGTVSVNNRTLFYKKGLADKKYPFSQYMLECDTRLHGRTISFLPYYTINILNLETGKEQKIKLRNAAIVMNSGRKNYHLEIERLAEDLKKMQA